MDLDRLLDNALELSVLNKTYYRLSNQVNNKPQFEYKDSYGTYLLKYGEGVWGIHRRGLLHPTYVWNQELCEWKDRDHRNQTAPLNLKVTKSLDVEVEATEYRADIMRKIFEKKPHPDLRIKLSDGSLLMAHKNVVSAVVPSWECMLNSGMIEARANVIEILDVEPTVARAFVDAIYCGTVTDRNLLCGVAVLADRYRATAIFKQVMLHIDKLMKVGAANYQQVQDLVKILPPSEEVEKLIMTMHTLIKNSNPESFCGMMGFHHLINKNDIEGEVKSCVDN